MEKILFDANPCDVGKSCPKFVLDEERGQVFLIDKKGNKAEMCIKDFNKFIDAVFAGNLMKIRRR
jgi:hypothetical protein